MWSLPELAVFDINEVESSVAGVRRFVARGRNFDTNISLVFVGDSVLGGPALPAFDLVVNDRRDAVEFSLLVPPSTRSTFHLMAYNPTDPREGGNDVFVLENALELGVRAQLRAV